MFLGIDTSCYTTSVAIVEDKNAVIDERIILDVKSGECGLRQSDAVFKHVKNFPVLIEKIKDYFPYIKAVAVSGFPRKAEGSYMPVFMTGETFAKTAAAACGAELYIQSHQENHISAAVNTTGFLDEKFLALHISGGTTEILFCRETVDGYECEIVGKTLDVSAGQLIDRIGVLGGERFPSGAHMDKIAAKGDVKFKTSVKGSDINFSGVETAAKRILTQDNKSEVYYAVFECVANSIKCAIKSAIEEAGAKTVVFVGGVASNSVIRQILTDEFGETAHFTLPRYSTDGAVGNAFLAQKRWNYEKRAIRV